jgi:uncharacterized SAM-binding protein YcdF (DUF218 family)
VTAPWLGWIKPVATALVLPPAPLILLAVAGAWLARRRPRAGSALVLVAAALLWLSACNGAARWVEDFGPAIAPPLDAAQRAQLKTRAAAGEPIAIVVLGGGMYADVPEYGGADLVPGALMRLRYAVWLARQTGLPVAASGGQGWAVAAPGIAAEATRMAEVAQAEYGMPLRWVESGSRDTSENAANTVAMLRAAGVREIVLVTHRVHMPRALHEFRAAAAAATPALAVTPAPMGRAWPDVRPVTGWMPSPEGASRMNWALHEMLGLLVSGR